MTRQLLRYFFHFTWQYKWNFLLHIGVVCVAEIASVAGVERSFQRVIDALSITREGVNAAPEIWRYALLYVGFYAFVALCWRVTSFASTAFKTKTARDIRSDVYERLLQHSYEFFAGNQIGALIAKATRLQSNYIKIMDIIGWDLLPLVVFYATTLGVLYSLDPRFSVIFIVWGALFSICVYLYTRYKQQFDERYAAMQSRLGGSLRISSVTSLR